MSGREKGGRNEGWRVKVITWTDCRIVALALFAEGPTALGAVRIRHTEPSPSLPALPTGGRTDAPGRPLFRRWITCQGAEHRKLPYPEVDHPIGLPFCFCIRERQKWVKRRDVAWILQALSWGASLSPLTLSGTMRTASIFLYERSSSKLGNYTSYINNAGAQWECIKREFHCWEFLRNNCKGVCPLQSLCHNSHQNDLIL